MPRSQSSVRTTSRSLPSPSRRRRRVMAPSRTRSTRDSGRNRSRSRAVLNGYRTPRTAKPIVVVRHRTSVPAAEVVEETQQCVVGRHDAVVEALHPRLLRPEERAEPAELVAGLQQDDVGAGPAQAVGGGESGDATADDDDPGPFRHHSPRNGGGASRSRSSSFRYCSIVRREPQLARRLLAVVPQDERHLDDPGPAVPELEEQLDHAGEALLLDEPLPVVARGATEQAHPVGPVTAGEVLDAVERQREAEEDGGSAGEQPAEAAGRWSRRRPRRSGTRWRGRRPRRARAASPGPGRRRGCRRRP